MKLNDRKKKQKQGRMFLAGQNIYPWMVQLTWESTIFSAVSLGAADAMSFISVVKANEKLSAGGISKTRESELEFQFQGIQEGGVPVLSNPRRWNSSFRVSKKVEFKF